MLNCQSLGNSLPDYICRSELHIAGIRIQPLNNHRLQNRHVFYSQGQDVMEFVGRSMESVSANRQDFCDTNSELKLLTVFMNRIPISGLGGRQSYWTDVYNDVRRTM